MGISATVVKPNQSKSVSKTRYSVASTAWSSSANADGYYTATVSLSPSIGSSPDVYIAGSTDGTQPTDTEKGQFAYVKRCKVNGSTLTLYASSKPSSTFYIWVEGVNGTGSGDIVGNVIQPNGVSSDLYSTSETLTNKVWIDGKPIYRKVIDFGALPNAGTKSVHTYLSNVRMVNVEVVAVNYTNGYVNPIPLMTSAQNVSYYIDMLNNDQIYVTSTVDKSMYSAYFILEYIKVS